MSRRLFLLRRKLPGNPGQREENSRFEKGFEPMAAYAWLPLVGSDHGQFDLSEFESDHGLVSEILITLNPKNIRSGPAN